MPQKLKDRFFTAESLQSFSEVLSLHYTVFDAEAFIRQVYAAEWEQLELMARMRHVAKSMRAFLPDDYVAALVILLKAAPGVKGFEGMTLPAFVELYGAGHMEESLNALGQLTRYSSSEFAIRPFLDRHPDVTMHYMKAWAGSKYHEVRRFASEGCRPRLPWAMVLPKFIVDPTPVLEVLELLRDDESLFVRRSVANNLNDISKDHPDVALDTAIRWYGYSDRTNWVVKHGLRTLLKQGNLRAMRLFNFGDPANIHIRGLNAIPASLKLGEETIFTFELENREEENRKIRLEYAIDFVKASGKTSTKVFQLAEREFKPGNSKIRKKHSFADLTTRRHYPGMHTIAILVNGIKKGGIRIELLEKN